MINGPKIVTHSLIFSVHLMAAMLWGLIATAVIAGVLFIVLGDLVTIPLIGVIIDYSALPAFLILTFFFQRRFITQLDMELVTIQAIIGATIIGGLSGLITAVTFHGPAILIFQYAAAALVVSILCVWQYRRHHRRLNIELVKEVEDE